MVLSLRDTGLQPGRRRRRHVPAGRNNSLIALDATTGKELWIHEGLGGIVSRGINYWQSADGKDKRLLFSINSYLQAIDATTGKSILTFGENGTVDLRIGLARSQYAGRIQSNSPGKIWKNLIILGSAAGEAFIAPPGDIRAYDVVTGHKVWQFHTIPQPGEFGYDTWPKEAYKYVGGANNWGSFSVDEERGIVYVPTGSANYDFYGADRVGQNLFANCLLALDAKTGKRLWHFQTVHHDLWDFDNVAAPQLVTVRHNGRKVDAVALAGKTNFLYVFDRVTGKPLWPIEERPVPKSEMPGEKAWPTQPWPTKPAPFGRMTFTVDDVNPWLATPEQYEAMKERVAKARNEGPFTPPGLTDTISMPGTRAARTGGRQRRIRRRGWCSSSGSIRLRFSSWRTSETVRCPRAAAAVGRVALRSRPDSSPISSTAPVSRREPARGPARRDRSRRHHRSHR